MTRILIIGGTGFVGEALVTRLVNLPSNVVTVVGRTRESDISKKPFFNKIHNYISSNAADIDESILSGFDHIYYLAWSHLDDFRSSKHLTECLPDAIKLFSKVRRVHSGKITVVGTCLEYGKHSGICDPEDITNPVVSYAIAKDALRRYLFAIFKSSPVTIIWTRIFFVYGENQRKGALLPSMLTAHNQKDSIFNMSYGDHKRDFLHVDDAADQIIRQSINSSKNIVYNCCSGYPLSVYEFALELISKYKLNIRIIRGKSSYPEYEKFEFWGKKWTD